MERTASSEFRLLRAVILLPLAIAAFALVFLLLGSDDARAGGLTDVLNSTEDTVSTAVSGVSEVAATTTKTTKEVVQSIATPPAEKPVTTVVETVAEAVPTVTKAVASTTTKTVQAATTTVQTVAKPVAEVVDPIVDGVVPGDGVPGEGETPVVLPTPIAVVEAAAASAASDTAGPVAAPRASDVVAAFVARSAAVVFDVSDAAAVAPAPVVLFAPLAPTPLAPAPVGGTIAAFAGAITLLAVLGARPHLTPAAARRSSDAADDELPSTPTFDTDTSPD